MAVRRDMIERHKGIIPLSRYELKDRIDRLSSPTTWLRDRALVALLYLTACRIEELVKYVIDKNNKRMVNRKTSDGRVVKVRDPIVESYLAGEPIMKKQIEFKGDEILIRNVRTLKRRMAINKTVGFIDNSLDGVFVDYVLDYIDTLNPDDYLFPITRKRAYQIMEQVNMFPHLLRHTRITHLNEDYNMGELELKQYVNWADTRQASVYVHMNPKNLMKKMRL